jgi:RNA polymerase sigma-70 factor (ECF subfamily)
VQEVFIAAFTRLESFRGDAQIDTWLYTIAANKVRNWWDSRRRRQARESAAHVRDEVDAETPETRLEATEQLDRLYGALGSLPDKFREAFTARAIENLSLEDASERLGVPISTVSYRTRRAEQMLCDALGLRVEKAS